MLGRRIWSLEGVSLAATERSVRFTSSFGVCKDGFTSDAVAGAGSGATTFLTTCFLGAQITTVGSGTTSFKCAVCGMSG